MNRLEFHIFTKFEIHTIITKVLIFLTVHDSIYCIFL